MALTVLAVARRNQPVLLEDSLSVCGRVKREIFYWLMACWARHLQMLAVSVKVHPPHRHNRTGCVWQPRHELAFPSTAITCSCIRLRQHIV
jgi:hypothetical protein